MSRRGKFFLRRLTQDLVDISLESMLKEESRQYAHGDDEIIPTKEKVDNAVLEKYEPNSFV